MGFIWVDDKEDDAKFKSHLDEKIKEATTSLSNTNDGLLKDVVKWKKVAKEKEHIDPEEYVKIKTENEKLKNDKKEGESEIEKQLRVAKEQLENDNKTLRKEVEILASESKKNLVDGQITQALATANVKPTLMNAAQRIIKADVAVVEVDGVRKAMVGDKTISEYVDGWSKTEEGKNFVLAAPNSGGNAGGDGGGSGGGPDDYDKFFDKKSGSYNLTQQTLLKKKDIELYNKLISKYK